MDPEVAGSIPANGTMFQSINLVAYRFGLATIDDLMSRPSCTWFLKIGANFKF